MRHLFAPLYWLLFFAAVAAFAVAVWAIGSETGGRWLIAQATALQPGLVEVEGFQGRLADRPRIGRITIDDGRQRIVLDGIELDYRLAPLAERRLRIRRLRIDTLHWRLPAKGRAGGKAAELPTLTLPFDARIDELRIGRLIVETAAGRQTMIDTIRLAARFHRDRLTIDALSLRLADIDIAAQGDVAFTAPPEAHLELHASDTDGNRVTARLDGRLQDYRLDAEIETTAQGRRPPATIRLSGTGDLGSLSIGQLDAVTMGGTLTANGTLRWRDGLRAEASFSGSGIDPGTIDPYYRGRVHFGGQAKFADGRLDTQLAILGDIQDYRFQIEADAELRRARLHFRQGRLVMGPNVLKFSGAIDRQAADGLVFSIDMPKLAALVPGLSGSIAGDGRLDGRWEAPRGRVDLSASALRWRDLSLQRLRASLRTTGQARQARYELTASGLARGGLRIDELRLRGELAEDHQRATVELRDPPRLRASLRLDGHYDATAQRWSGHLEGLRLHLFDLPAYRQQQASAIAIGRRSLDLQTTCLSDGQARLCLDARLAPARPVAASARLQRFPLKRLARWLPLTKYLDDTVTARIDLGGDFERLEADAGLTLDAANRLTARLLFTPADGGIGGHVEGRFDRLKWIEAVSEGLMDPSGHVTLKAAIGGTLRQPTIDGTVALRDAAVRLPAAGIRVTGISVEATTRDGRSATIRGELHAGGGSIRLDGEAGWPSSKTWQATLALRGNDFQAADLPMARVWVSPELRLVARPRRIEVNGELFVPKAEIRLKRLPETAITPSADVYFLDADTRTEQSRLQVYSRIVLRLGKAVRLRGFGLDARLAGKLVITESPDQAISGDGSLKVAEGHYEALGQKLEIERGELYWNGPFNSPGLNLRAVRKAEGITTGLEIRGSIQQPESRIFSDPVMDETNALAYLITGKPLGATSAADSDMLLTAVARLGLKGSATLVDDLRRRAGLDVLAIQPGEELQQSALVIGKYLSPRFYLEYTTSLFEEASVLSIRYKLNRYLKLQAESSDKRQAIDLIYEIEH